MSLTRPAIQRQYNAEMTNAWERIAAMPQGEIGWLVSFIQLDLDALTPSEWMIRAYEVASFTEGAGYDPHVPPLVSASGWSVHAIPGETEHYTLPSRKEGIRLQEAIRGYLETLWATAITPITFSDLTIIVTLPGAFHDRYGSVLVATKPKTKEFEYRCAVLLARYAGYVRRCRECRRIFLAARRDQGFCQPRCQMRVASRKYRATQKHRARKERR